MKKDNYVLSSLLQLYFLAFFTIRIYLFFAQQPCQSTAKRPSQAPGAWPLIHQSSRFDNTHLELTGVVSQSGNLFFDCLFISTYRIVLPDGYGITIYTRGPVPEEGAMVTTCGTYRQLYHGKIISNWCGLLEHEHRRYLKDIVTSIE